jgi:hypothetical protein
MKFSNWVYAFSIVMFISVGIYLLFPKINGDDAVDAIVGEAANQSEDTMICVAQAIRHRGTLKGVYGLHAKHNHTESSDVWEAAQDAWDMSDVMKDQVNGAKNWGTFSEWDITNTFEKAKCGDLYFY